MKFTYKKAVFAALNRTKELQPEILTEKDLKPLPEIVRKYLRYGGFVGKKKIRNFRSVFKGGIRFKPGEDYMPFWSEQYNFYDIPTRLFYIRSKKAGIPAYGLHLYEGSKAIFRIKILGLFTVVDAKGPKMDQGETVTVLNDMFIMAPTTLIDPQIQWEIIDDLKVKAIYTNQSITVEAEVHFAEDGRIRNFISNDRFETNGKEYISNPWETPVSDYREINGYRLPSKAKMIYKRPEGDFCYGEFELESMDYNVREFV